MKFELRNNRDFWAGMLFLVFAGAEPVGGSPEQFKTFIESEFKKWQVVVKDSGATAVAGRVLIQIQCGAALDPDE